MSHSEVCSSCTCNGGNVTEHLWGRGDLEALTKQLEQYELKQGAEKPENFWKISVTGKKVLIERFKKEQDNFVPIFPDGPVNSEARIDITMIFYQDFPKGYQARVVLTEAYIQKQLFNLESTPKLNVFLRQAGADGPVVSIGVCSNVTELPVITVQVDTNIDDPAVKPKVIGTIKNLWKDYCVTEKTFSSITV